LQNVAPDARISVDENAGTILVWATPKQQQMIGEAIQKMVAQAGGESGTKMAVYNVPHTGAPTAYTLLRPAFPRVTFTYTSSDPSRLLAWGPARDHKLIQQIVDQLEDTAGLELRIYDASAIGATQTRDLLANVVPDVKFTIGSDGNSLIAWAKPEDHALINQAITQLREEKQKQGEREMQLYPLEEIDASTVQSVLRDMFPNIRILASPRTPTLVIWASKAEHEKIAAAIRKLDAGPDEKHRAKLETYPLGAADPDSVLNFLRQAVPDARLSIDSGSGTLMAWATPKDHETIRTTVEKMVRAAETSGGSQVVVYDVKNLRANTLYPLVRQAFPQMQFNYNGNDLSKLVAWGTAADHKKLAALLKQLEADAAKREGMELKSYDVEAVGASQAQSMLAQIVPQASFSTGTDGKTLIVWATPEQHTLIQKLIESLPPIPKAVTRAYRFEHTQASTVYSAIASLVPQARIVLDPPNNRILVTALPDDMAKVEAAVTELDREDVEHEPKLVVYPTGEADPSLVASFLSSAVPNARISVDSNTRKLMVWATPAEHATIKTTIDELLQQVGEGASQVVVYDVKTMGANTIYYILRDAFPQMRFNYNSTDLSKLLAWGTAADHKKLAQLIKQLEAAAKKQEGMELRSYDVKSVGGASQAQSMLVRIVPRATLSTGADPNTLVAWATAEEHALIEQAINAMPQVPEPVTRAFPLEHTQASTLVPALQRLLPQAQVTVDSTNNRLIVSASPDDVTRAETLIQELDQEDPEHKRTLVVYPVGDAEPSTVASFLSTVVPNARISVDATTRSVMAWATASDHQTIKTTIEELIKAAGEGGTKVVVYDVKVMRAHTVYPILRQAFPRMSFNYNSSDLTKLIAWGTAGDHKKLAELIKQLEAAAAKQEGMELRSYDVEAVGVSQAQSMLSRIVPQATFSSGTDGKTLIVWASPEQHALIEQVINSLPPVTKAVTRAYRIQHAQVSSIYSAVRSLVPQAQMVIDSPNNRIIVTALPDDLAKVEAALAELDREDAEHKPTLVVYPTGEADPSLVRSFLSSVVPNARIDVDPSTRRLMVWATPTEHATIKATIDELIKQVGEGASRVAVYDVKAMGANTVYYILREAFPQMRFNYNTRDLSKLIAWGTPSDHKKLAELIKQLEAAAVKQEGMELRSYDVESVGASRAQTMLARVVPRATFSVGADPDTLIVWATPEEHTLIEQVVNSLPPAPEVATRAFRLEHARASSVYSALRSLVPQAVLALDTANNRVIVTALPDDMKKIEAAVTELDREDVEHKPTLALYDVGEADPSTVSTFLQSVVPNARINVDQNTGKIMAWATPTEHATIKTTIEQMMKEAGEGATKVVVYDVTATGAASAYYILNRAFPRMQFTYSPRDPSHLVAWGPAIDHEKVKKIVDQLEDSAARLAGFELRSYEVESIGASRAQVVLSRIVPRATLAVGTDPDTLLAWATPEDHAIIEQIVSQLPPAPEVVSRVYRLQHADVRAVYSTLRTLVPQASVAMDTANRSVIVSALPDDQEKVAAAIQELDAEDAEHKPTLVVYPVGDADPDTVSQFLSNAFPNARVTVDQEAGTVLVWATPAEHTAIKTTIEEISKRAGQGGTKVVSYDVSGTGARNAYYFLRYAFPRMRITYSIRDDTRLIAWGSAKDHEKLAALIQQLEDEATRQANYEVRSYDVEAVGATRAQQMLREVAPKATFAVGSDRNTLIAWASPEDHERIQKIVSQLPPVPKMVSHIYYLRRADPRAALNVLQALVPDAEMSVDRENRSIIVSATEEDHEKIKAAVEEMDQERPDAPTPRIQIHPFKKADPRDVYYALRMMYRNRPDVHMALDSGNDTLLVVAPPEVHEKIDQLIADIEAAGGAMRQGMTVKTYDVESVGAIEARSILRKAVPKAEFTVGEDPDKLIVRARPEDHVLIEEILKELPPKPKPVSRIYYFRRADPQAALPVLEALAPRAEMAVDEENRSIIVSATDEDHERIKAAVEDMDRERPDAPTPRLQIHPFKTADPRDVYVALRAMYRFRRDVQMALDTTNDTLIVVAPPEVHEKVDQLIAEVEAAGKEMRQGMTVKTYDIQSVDVRDARDILRKAVPKAEFTIGEDPTKLIVRARPEDHVLIEQVLKELPPRRQMISRIYYLRKADPRAALSVLEKLAPNAEMAVDEENSSIIVSATEEDHARLKAAVSELEKEQPDAPIPRPQTYKVTAADPYNLYRTLLSLYRRRDDVQITIDRVNDTLVVIAPPDEHKKIGELIKTVEQAGTSEGPEKLEFYSIKNMDATAVLTVVQNLLERQAGRDSKSYVSLAPRSEQLVVVARPEVHELIRKALEGLKAEEPVLEVYQLEMVDPLTAELAISRLFDSRTGQPVPLVDSDSATQRLFVRATAEQQEKIRELLVKMGEEGLTVRRGTTGSARLRVIPFDGDATQAVEEIRRVWSQIRKNPIQVIKPHHMLRPPAKKPESEPDENSQKKPAAGAPQSKAKPSGAAPAKSSGDTSASIRPVNRPARSALAAAGISDVGLSIVAALAASRDEGQERPPRSADPGRVKIEPGGRAPEPADPPSSPSTLPGRPASAPLPDEPPKSLSQQKSQQTGAARSERPASASAIEDAATESANSDSEQEPPPIVVIVGTDSVTITSDDPEALNQFENLLRSLSGRAGMVGRNLMIVPLQNVTATMVSMTLNRLFRDSRYGSVATGPVTVVPDERLNAVIVHANRADRSMIRNLIAVLDTAEIPDSQAIKRAMIIPVKNTDARRIEAVIRNIYRTQLMSRGLTQPVRIPSGIPSRLASALQQLNAAAAGPLLTIDVEDQSNSLVVMGPTPLLEEIKQLVDELDRVAKEERDRQIRVIPLKKTNSLRVQQALQMLRGRGSYSRSRSRYRSR